MAKTNLKNMEINIYNYIKQKTLSFNLQLIIMAKTNLKNMEINIYNYIKKNLII